VRGYHGTSAEAAASIAQEGFRRSQEPWDWLGEGIYFFQDAPARAREWSVQQGATSPVVLAAVIRLEDCMDLLDIEWAQVIVDAYYDFVRLFAENGWSLPQNRGGNRQLDKQVMDYVVGWLGTQGQPVRVIRAVFVEGSPLYPESALYDRGHVQVAVRDPTLIETIVTVAERE